MDPLAIYAAFVATGALGWHVVSWVLGHMTRVRVAIEATQLVVGEGVEAHRGIGRRLGS